MVSIRGEPASNPPPASACSGRASIQAPIITTTGTAASAARLANDRSIRRATYLTLEMATGLADVCAKVGVRSRTELTAALGRE